MPLKNYPRSKLISGLPTSLQLYTIAEVAIILAVDSRLVNQWIDNELLPTIQLGKEKFFTRIRGQELELFIEQIRDGFIDLNIENQQNEEKE